MKSTADSSDVPPQEKGMGNSIGSSKDAPDGMMASIESVRFFRSFSLLNDRFTPGKTPLIVESPLDIRINERPYILTMVTPCMIQELVVGFLFTEGIIQHIREVEECLIEPVQKEDGDEVIVARVRVPEGCSLPAERNSKRVSFSSCGICGNLSYDQIKGGMKRVKSGQRFSLDALIAFSMKMKSLQPLYRETGGAHAAFLLDPLGNGVLHAEDMGRHNAMDKVIGAALLNRVAFEDKALMSSGRASLEMILKAARAGVPLFVAVSRPTSRAVEAARFYNITLMDLARGGYRVYSHVRRIEDA